LTQKKKKSIRRKRKRLLLELSERPERGPPGRSEYERPLILMGRILKQSLQNRLGQGKKGELSKLWMAYFVKKAPERRKQKVRKEEKRERGSTIVNQGSSLSYSKPDQSVRSGTTSDNSKA